MSELPELPYHDTSYRTIVELFMAMDLTVEPQTPFPAVMYNNRVQQMSNRLLQISYHCLMSSNVAHKHCPRSAVDCHSMHTMMYNNPSLLNTWLRVHSHLMQQSTDELTGKYPRAYRVIAHRHMVGVQRKCS